MSDLKSFFSDQGKLPEKLKADDLNPKIEKLDVAIDNATPIEDNQKEGEIIGEKKKDFGAVLNDVGELVDKENVSAKDVANALGAEIKQTSKEDLDLAEELGLGAEDIIDLIDAGRQWLYLSAYDNKVKLELREDELNRLIQKSNRSTEEDARMKQLNAFLAPARKQRQKFVDGIPYKGGLRKRLEKVAKVALAKVVRSGKVPEWLVILILMGIQDGKLIINLNADNKSLPKL